MMKTRLAWLHLLESKGETAPMYMVKISATVRHVLRAIITKYLIFVYLMKMTKYVL